MQTSKNDFFNKQQCVKITVDSQFLGMADTPCGTCVCSETPPHQMLEPCLKQAECVSQAMKGGKKTPYEMERN